MRLDMRNHLYQLDLLDDLRLLIEQNNIVAFTLKA